MNKTLFQTELEKLSPDQRKAVLSKSRFLRIVAGAGAGKTTTMAMRIVYLLSQGVKPKEIIAFTFTEKAAQNMKNRVYEKIEKIEPALCNLLGEMYIGTIHAFCFQMLQDHFGFGNYEALDENEETAFILRRGWGLGLGSKGSYTHNCNTFLKSIDVAYDELIPINDLKIKQPEFHKHFRTYEEMLDKNKLLTFSRMTSLLVAKLNGNYTPLEYIKYLIVDEYQDVNKAQQELIRIIGQKASVYVVGDPRQCIYQWRGSNESSFDNFMTLFKKPEAITIHENRRSVISIVDAANKFSSTLKGKYEFLKPIRKEKGKVIKVVFENPKEEANIVTEKIKEIVEKRKKCNYSDVAILLRSVKTSAEYFIDYFKEKKIPFIVGGKIGLFKRDEAQIVGILFTWLSDNGFWLRKSYDWSNPLKGDDLLKRAKELWENLMSRDDFPEETLKKWKEEILNGSYNGLTEAFQELLIILKFLELDQNNKLHAAILANLGRFNTLLTDYQTSVRLGGDKFDWKKDIKGLFWYMNTYATESYEEQPAEDIRGVDAVQIMTVHQAKGLEWLTVFIPSLTQMRFPSSNSGKEQDWMIKRDLFPVERYEGTEQDERRLFYVAMTRARDLLCFSYFKQINKPMQESKFLENLHLKEEKAELILKELNLNNVSKEDEIQTFAGGEIIDYSRCNYFYRMRHLWGYKNLFHHLFGFGKSLHHCLRRVCEIVQKEKVEPLEALDKVFDTEGFHLPYANRIAKDIAAKNAKETIKKYIEKHKEDILNVQEVESRIEFPLEKSTIAGRVDVIIGPDKKCREVRDYKTTDLITSIDEATLQVQVYTIGLNLTKQKIDKATIAYLKETEAKTQIISVDIADKDLAKAKEKAKEAILGIKRGVWRAKCGEHCKNCDFRNICRYNSLPKKLVVKI